MNKVSKRKIRSSKKRGESVNNEKYNKVFTEAEVREKKGFVEPTKALFIAIIQSHSMHKFYHKYKDNLTGVAQGLYEAEFLFVKSHGMFKLMKLNSISNYVHRYSKEAAQQLKEEKDKADKYKHKK